VGTGKTKPAFDQLTEQLERYPSLDKLHVQRNLALGGAAACLIILIELFSVGIPSVSLRVALVACAVAIPAWVGMAGLIEYYIVLGPKSYGHRRTPAAQALIGVPFLTGGIGLITAIGGILYYLAPAAAYVFGIAVLAILLVSLVFHAHLGYWYNRRDSGGQHPGGDT
jgi:hypothetical protein